MHHLAVRSHSLFSDRPFTATGLGDRIHQLTCAWCYGPPVTLHIDQRKMEGGQFGNKPESWQEIIDLFPAGSITLQAHDIRPESEAEWLKHLDGIPVWGYGNGLDIEPYLQNVPLLKAEANEYLPDDKFITEQWDANGPARCFPDYQKVRAKWLSKYDVVTLGGWGSGPFRWSLQHAAGALSHAEAHIGVDSAFFHMAMLYMPMERIHIYTTGAMSHHLKRSRANGASVLHHA